jgi:hypothetical protein
MRAAGVVPSFEVAVMYCHVVSCELRSWPRFGFPLGTQPLEVV